MAHRSVDSFLNHGNTPITPADETRSPSSERLQVFTDSYASNRSSRSSSVSSVIACPPPRKLSTAQSILDDLTNYVAAGSIRIGGEDNPINFKKEGSLELLAQGENAASVFIEYPFLKQLLAASWVRAFLLQNRKHPDYGSIRCYILAEDVGRGHLRRTDKNLRKALRTILAHLDVAPEAWNAGYELDTQARPMLSDAQPDASLSSLFYLYNTLKSPDPSPENVPVRHTRSAMETLLDPNDAPDGLKTTLYPYQRRSAAMMLQKEAAPTLQLDPRLRQMAGLDGRTFYFDQETMGVLQHPRLYEEARGGILAETMGLGKTLICLAVILASKGHWPRIPAEYSTGLLPRREKVGSLLDMAASTIGRYSIPWKPHFGALTEAGEDHSRCIELLKKNVGRYEIPGAPPRSLRATAMPKSRPIRLSTATIVIVPANLVNQWLDEIKKHTKDGSLKMLVMDSLKKELPGAEALADFDVILFSKPRWEREVRDGEDSKGRRAPQGMQLSCACPYIGATRQRDCSCFRDVEIYSSPLKQIHWLRIIVDEGHSFASSGSKSNAVLVAGELQTDSRWVISGTPTKGLMGVEVELAASEHQKVEWEERDNLSPKTRRKALESRKSGADWLQEKKDVEKLGRIAVDYLKLRPWANVWPIEPTAPAWMWHMYRPAAAGQFAGYSECLKRTLKGLIVKHRAEDFEIDVQLPPLYNQLVYLEPAFFDRLSINLFLAVLTTNAVTSEREDTDYLWHPRNRKSLNTLVSNLRQSGFFWTGFSEKDVSEALKHAENYLESKGDQCPERDRNALTKALAVAKMALQSSGWLAFSQFHELGLFVEKWPEEHAAAWALDARATIPMVVGLTQLIKAQKYVNNQLYASDPSTGLSAAGKSAMEAAFDHARTHNKDSGTKDKGISTSSSLQEAPPTPKKKHKWWKERGRTPNPVESVATNGLKSALKRPSAPVMCPALPPDSPLAQASITGTASAKLSYLLDKILSLYRSEKILVFYEGEDIAYYIAQALEVVDIQYLIYAKSLSTERRSSYVVTFNTTETFRVLLMDVNQASHGLNMSSASRVFFVNAIWQPNVEAQAIKRAHRIGQTRPVYVETLVLKGTIEDQMLQRRKSMTNQELQKAEKSLLDDNGMTSIIQHAEFLPLSPEEMQGPAQMAPLKHPQQVFARPTRCGVLNDDPDAGLIGISTAGKPKKRRTNLQAGFALPTDPCVNASGEANNNSSSSSRMSSPALPPQRSVAFDTSAADEIRAAGGIIMEPPRARSSPIKPKPKKVARFLIDDDDDTEQKSSQTTPSGTSPATTKSRPSVNFSMEGVEYTSAPESKPVSSPLPPTAAKATSLNGPDIDNIHHGSTNTTPTAVHYDLSNNPALRLHYPDSPPDAHHHSTFSTFAVPPQSSSFSQHNTTNDHRSPPPSTSFSLGFLHPFPRPPASPLSASGSTTATETPPVSYSPLSSSSLPASGSRSPAGRNTTSPHGQTPDASSSANINPNEPARSATNIPPPSFSPTTTATATATATAENTTHEQKQEQEPLRRQSLFGGISLPPVPVYRRPF